MHAVPVCISRSLPVLSPVLMYVHRQPHVHRQPLELQYYIYDDNGSVHTMIKFQPVTMAAGMYNYHRYCRSMQLEQVLKAKLALEVALFTVGRTSPEVPVYRIPDEKL